MTTKHLTAIAAIVIVFAGIHFAAPVLVPIAFAAVVVAVTSPLAAAMRRRGVPTVLAAFLTIIADLGLLGGIGALLALAGAELQVRGPFYIGRVQAGIAESAASLSHHGLGGVGAALGKLDADDMMPYLGALATDAVSLVSNGGIVLLIVFFTLCEMTSIGTKIGLLSSDPKANVVPIARAVSEVQRYLLVKAGTGALAAGATFLLLKVCGVNLAILLALTLLVFHFIPNVGAVIATFPAVAVAAVDRGIGIAIVVGVGMSAINFVVGNLVEPRVLGRTLGLSPLAVFLSILFWGWMWGASGALLAVPIIVLVKAFLENTTEHAWLAKFFEPAPAVAPPVEDALL